MYNSKLAQLKHDFPDIDTAAAQLKVATGSSRVVGVRTPAVSGYTRKRTTTRRRAPARKAGAAAPAPKRRTVRRKATKRK